MPLTLLIATMAAVLGGEVLDPGAAGGAAGLWLTGHDHGIVEVFACDAALCGRIVTSDRLKAHPDQVDERNAEESLRRRPIKGLSIFYGVKGGPPVWSGGRVYNPTDGRTYEGSIRLIDPNTLKLTGCVFYPLCRSEIWTRVR